MRLSFCPVAAALVATVALLPACGGVSTGTSGDGGTHPDAGVDAGMVDAGMHPDAGIDAGMPDAGMDGGSSSQVAQAQMLLNQVTAGMKSFHKDTGGWPEGNSVWYGGAPSFDPNYMPTDLWPATQFTKLDTALFSSPSSTGSTDGGAPGGLIDPVSMMNLMPCGSPHMQPCSGGPYLTIEGATSLADVKDPWGNALYFTYLQPFGGATGTTGGGTPGAMMGAVVIWSAGPDGIDQTGCSDGSCPANEDNVATGQPSVAGADDIITVVTMDSQSTM